MTTAMRVAWSNVLEVESRKARAKYDGALAGPHEGPFHAVLQRLGLPSAHCFRHSHRSRLRRAGVSDELQRRLLGHRSRDVTANYGAAGENELLCAVERLE